jgi:SPP1 family phage portal protein
MIMSVDEIFTMTTPEEIIQELKKGRGAELPDIEKYISAIDPQKHLIFDEIERPNKLIKNENGEIRTEKVARIALALQKLIVKRAASFLFGNPVEYVLQATANEQQKLVFTAFQEIMDDVKINSLNRKIAKALFSCTEIAELWYPVPLEEGEEPRYGIGSRFKLRMSILNPMKGDILYPYFNDYGDLVAFSREYTTKNSGRNKRYFETYTDNFIYKFDITEGAATLVEGFPKENPIGKIPIVYAQTETADYEDVQCMIERLEKLLSNFADTNDYHASPTIFVKGAIKGFSKKGESGKILVGEKESEANYLSWTHAPEAVKLEISSLLDLIYTISQTPNIAFENVKSIGTGISGKALKLMFLDAHLKVQDHMEVFDEYLQRRTSVVKAFIGHFNTKLASIAKATDIEFMITPFMMDDESDKLEVIMTATGNKAVMSQKTGVKMAGFVADAEAELRQIQQEEKELNTIQSFPISV